MDPLRPFASLLRSLRSTAKVRAAGARSEQSSPPHPQPPVGHAHSQLQARLRTLPEWHAPRAREMFVESILLAELGEDLALDPEFHVLIQEVSKHLGGQAQLSGRLDQLLRELHSAAR